MIRLSITTGLFLMTFINGNVRAASLTDSFKSSLLTNQVDNISDSRLKQSYEAKSRGQGRYLPTLSAKGNYLKQDNSETQRTAGLNLTSSLYNGGRDQITVENAETGIKIAQNQKEIERTNLYIDVVDAYFTYFLNQNDLKNIELLKKQSQERADEIRKRVQIGRSRKGELLQAEAQLASVEAQLSNAVGLVKESAARFYILTGLSQSENVEVNLTEKIETKTLQEYLDLALSREDIKNKELEIEKINGELRISKSHFAPKLDLLSNYYLVKEGVSASSKNSDWDVGLALTIPLYEGGVSQSKVREDVERKMTAQYQLLDYKKSITVDVSSRYEIFRRYYDQIKAFDLALDKAKKSYEETLRDYRLGLVSNLDVLSSLNLYLDSKRNAEKTKVQVLLNHKILEAVAGEIPQV